MKRKKPLGSSLEARRGFEQRARQKAQANAYAPAENGREGMRSSALRRNPATWKPVKPKPVRVPRNRPRRAYGPLRPGEWRGAVWELDGGRSVLSGTPVPRHGRSNVWQAHHPLAKRFLPDGWAFDPRNGVILLPLEHRRHEARYLDETGYDYTIALEVLPPRVLAFAVELDERGILDQSAVELLRRYHPPAAELARPGGQRVV